MYNYRIQRLKAASPEAARAIAALVPQLSPNAPPFTRQHLEEMLSAPSTSVFAAVVNETIIGLTTLIIFRATTVAAPTSITLW